MDDEVGTKLGMTRKEKGGQDVMSVRLSEPRGVYVGRTVGLTNPGLWILSSLDLEGLRSTLWSTGSTLCLLHLFGPSRKVLRVRTT